jgi:hypothetical protein
VSHSEHAPPALLRRGRPRPVTVPLTAAGATTSIITSPGRLIGWSLLSTSATAPPTAVGAAAAAGNGTATLAAGASISGFDVNGQPASAATYVTVTVTGAAGGTLTYYVAGNAAETMALSVRYPQPLTPASPVVGIAVTVTGQAASPAFTIAAYGSTTSSSDATGFLYDGGQIVGALAASNGQATEKDLPDEGIYIGTSLAITVLAGSFQGTVYWLDQWHGGDN